MKIAVVLLVSLLTGAAGAQGGTRQSASAQIRFTVRNPQVEPAVYSLNIDENGSGRYTASYTASATSDVDGQQVSEPIQVHNPLLSQLFQAARAHHFFAFNCDDRRHSVAFSGEKTLAYAGPDGAGSCTFNYSREQWLDKITVDLIGISNTLEFGVRLKREHRYDPLALDGELALLQKAVLQRRALEPENIAPQLRAIAEDDTVMNRARTRARALLAEVARIH